MFSSFARPVTWSSTFPEVAVVQPTTGLMLAIASGTTQISAAIAGKVGRRTVTIITLLPTRKAADA
jgi:uncharacterized protein YjdB